jgi:hypothetical protein
VAGRAPSASGTQVNVAYSASNPLIFRAPELSAGLSARLSATQASIRFEATNFPSHGFALYRNGTLLRSEVVTNVACENATGPGGLTTVSAGLFTRSTANRTVLLSASSGAVLAPCSGGRGRA